MQASYQLIASLNSLSLVKLLAGRMMKLRRASSELTQQRQYGLKPAKCGDIRNTMKKRLDTMSLNSVNTNMGAMIALQSLNRTNTDLAATEKRISTGSRVADSTDDGAAYAVAQSVRSTIGALVPPTSSSATCRAAVHHAVGPE